jgi:hypothetical protein
MEFVAELFSSVRNAVKKSWRPQILRYWRDVNRWNTTDDNKGYTNFYQQGA